jgi:hypothetical protein
MTYLDERHSLSARIQALVQSSEADARYMPVTAAIPIRELVARSITAGQHST